MSNIHPTAIIDKDAKISSNAIIGPYCYIGKNVIIGEETYLYSHVVINGNVQIGSKCKIYPFTTIGLEPQDIKYQGEESRVVIGNNNLIREGVTIHRGTRHRECLTKIGDNNIFLAYSHVAHDCFIGNGVMILHLAALAGHVNVEDYAIIGAYSGVHQFCSVGTYSFIGAHSAVTKDVLPFSFVAGDRAKLYGINSIGLHRHNFNQNTIDIINNAIKIIKKTELSAAINTIKENWGNIPEINHLIEFIQKSKRGFIK
jgi:UDP-N-acetylglucosamine acyltransferase